MTYRFPETIPAGLCKIRDRVSMIIGRFRAKVIAFLWGIKLGNNCRLQGKTIIRRCARHNNDRIIIGNNVVINSALMSNLVGIVNPSILDTRLGGQIIIGDNTGLTSPVLSSKESITIGKNIKIGANVRIFDHDFHSLDPAIRRTSDDREHIRCRPIEIGDDCFIGTNAIILKGTRLGARTIVAAGSVVFGLIAPPDSLVKGNPAQIIKR